MNHEPTDTHSEVATLAGGCFWCLEAIYDQLKGVELLIDPEIDKGPHRLMHGVDHGGVGSRGARDHGICCRPVRRSFSLEPDAVSSTIASDVTSITLRSPIWKAAPVRSTRDHEGGMR